MGEDDDSVATKLRQATGLAQFTCLNCAHEVFVDQQTKRIYPASGAIIQQILRDKGRALFLEDEDDEF
jgi:hypothetical protein